MKTTYYQKLATVAVFAVPVAPAVFLGLRLFAQGREEAAEMFTGNALSVVLLLLALAAGLTAVGLELVGILSGHITARLFQRKDWRWVLTGAALIAYTVLGFYSLRGTVGAFAFLIAPLIYFVTAVGNVADDQQAKEATQEEEDAAEARRLHDEQIAFERRQQEQQAAFERQLLMSQQEGAQRLQMREAELKSQERAARATARAAQPTAAALSPAQSRWKAGSLPAQQPQAAGSTAQAVLTCAGCGYITTKGLQSLKGHQRWCEPYAALKLTQPEGGEEAAVLLHSSNGRH